MTVTKIAPDQRFHSQIDWLESFHIFNFSQHYRDGRNGFGDLLVVNDDIVRANRGFGMHPHHDMEIVTWVLSGTLSHEDNQGNKGTITPGEIQQMSAGSGVLHSEINPSTDEDVHLLQMWVLPDVMRAQPRYQQENVEHLINNNLACVASGATDAPIHLHNKTASLHVGRFDVDSTVALTSNEKLYVYMARGTGIFESEKVTTGESLLIDSAQTETTIDVSTESELVVWSIDSHARAKSNFRD